MIEVEPLVGFYLYDLYKEFLRILYNFDKKLIENIDCSYQISKTLNLIGCSSDDILFLLLIFSSCHVNVFLNMLFPPEICMPQTLNWLPQTGPPFSTLIIL